MKPMMMNCAALALSTLVMGVGEAQTLREACAADAARLCPDARDLRSRIQCMNAHRPELSDGCRKAREGNQQESTPTANATSAVTPPAPALQPDLVAPDGGLNSVAARVSGRSFPSMFAPWNFAPSRPTSPNPPAAGNSSGQDARIASISRHDLYWNEWNALGLRAAADQPYIILSPQFAAESLQAALRNRAALLAANSNLVILANVHYFSANAGANWLPPDSPWWRGTQKANNEYNSRRLDFTNPAFQDKVAALCGALVKSGVFDGCMLDLWNDQWDNKQNYAQESAARVPLIQKIRAAVGDQAILVGNVNGQLPSRTAAYLNGMYMEGLGSAFFPDWHTAAENLLWAQGHLRQPAITALEGWYPCPSPDCLGDPAQIQRQGRADLARMRNITTLSLVFSNGYVLFADPNELPTPDHLHDWYPFWNKSLGHPVGPIATLNRPDLSGAYTRQYERGEVVFNPPSNRPVTVNFPEPRRSAATNITGRSFTVAAADGDLFLKLSSTQP